MTLDEAKQLTHGQTVYHVNNRNADGTPQRWRVSGQVKTWKRDASRIRVPMKHGLYDNNAIESEADCALVELSEELASPRLFNDVYPFQSFD